MPMRAAGRSSLIFIGTTPLQYRLMHFSTQFSNCIPLFHSYVLAPAAEFALELLHNHCDAQQLVVTGCYYIPSETILDPKIPDSFNSASREPERSVYFMFAKIHAQLSAHFGPIPFLTMSNTALKNLIGEGDDFEPLFTVRISDLSHGGDLIEVFPPSRRVLTRRGEDYELSDISSLEKNEDEDMPVEDIVKNLSQLAFTKNRVFRTFKDLVCQNTYNNVIDFDDYANNGSGVRFADWLSNGYIDIEIQKVLDPPALTEPSSVESKKTV